MMNGEMTPRDRFEELLDDWAMGRLSSTEARAMEDLLASHPHWREEAEDHRALLGLMTRAPRPAAPAGLLEGALARAAASETEGSSPANVVTVVPVPAPQTRRRSGAKLLWGAAAAAALVAVAGLGAWQAMNTSDDRMMAELAGGARPAAYSISDRAAAKVQATSAERRVVTSLEADMARPAAEEASSEAAPTLQGDPFGTAGASMAAVADLEEDAPTEIAAAPTPKTVIFGEAEMMFLLPPDEPRYAYDEAEASTAAAPEAAVAQAPLPDADEVDAFAMQDSTALAMTAPTPTSAGEALVKESIAQALVNRLRSNRVGGPSAPAPEPASMDALTEPAQEESQAIAMAPTPARAESTWDEVLSRQSQEARSARVGQEPTGSLPPQDFETFERKDEAPAVAALPQEEGSSAFALKSAEEERGLLAFARPGAASGFAPPAAPAPAPYEMEEVEFLVTQAIYAGGRPTDAALIPTGDARARRFESGPAPSEEEDTPLEIASALEAMMMTPADAPRAQRSATALAPSDAGRLSGGIKTTAAPDVAAATPTQAAPQGPKEIVLTFRSRTQFESFQRRVQREAFRAGRPIETARVAPQVEELPDGTLRVTLRPKAPATPAPTPTP